MSELKLREFGARAEQLVDLPDLAELEQRGRDLRRRRLATVAAVAAAVLATVGIVTLRGDPPESVGPVKLPEDGFGGTQPYPGPVMEDLAAGTYRLRVSSDPLFPTATITVPDGWNAWQGPNRFDGHASGQDNEQALGHLTWYVGVLILDVHDVSTELCRNPRAGDDVGPTARSLVRAIRGMPGFRVSVDAVPDSMFGHPATHLRLATTPATRDCDHNLFDTTYHGVVGGFADGEDVWVVDVEGNPVLVEAQRSDGTPPQVQQELEQIITSIEFHPSELATDR